MIYVVTYDSNVQPDLLECEPEEVRHDLCGTYGSDAVDAARVETWRLTVRGVVRATWGLYATSVQIVPYADIPGAVRAALDLDA